MSSSATTATATTTASRLAIVAFRVTTALSAAALAVGGVSNIMRLEHVREVSLQQLGYPVYFPLILGAWKLAGAVALTVPRFPRLKEWAYAGAIFTYTGAVASHLAVGDRAGALTPSIIAAIALVSWALAPAARLRPAPGASTSIPNRPVASKIPEPTVRRPG